jgi:hypothetical protein
VSDRFILFVLLPIAATLIAFMCFALWGIYLMILKVRCSHGFHRFADIIGLNGVGKCQWCGAYTLQIGGDSLIRDVASELISIARRCDKT